MWRCWPATRPRADPARAGARRVTATLLAALLAGGCAPVGNGIRQAAGGRTPEATAPGAPTRAFVPPGGATPASAAGSAGSGPVEGPTVAYLAAAPAVAYVEGSLSTGSAILVERDLLLTNAHVVWPDRRVRVAFADGSERTGAPVTHLDLVADLALIDLGPVGGAPSGVAALTPAEDADPAVGTELYLVGYPGEAEDLPQPALSRGLLSRLRTWIGPGLRYLQSDAAIAGGQSGGALVDARGGWVGVSCMTFGDGAFGLSLSAVDAMERVGGMLAGQDVDEIADRELPLEGGRGEHTVALADAWSEAVLVGALATGTRLDVRATDPRDAFIDVLDPFGELVASSDDGRGATRPRVEWTVTDPGPHVVLAWLEGTGVLELEASPDLARFVDPDDGAVLAGGESRSGALDFPGDLDVMYVDLQSDGAYRLTIDTASFYPDAVLEPVDPSLDLPVLEAEVGGALGLTFSARVRVGATGRYALTVRDPDDLGFGGYSAGVSVEE